MPDDIPPGLELTAEGIYVVSGDTHLSSWIRDEHHRLDVSDGQIAFYAKHIPVGGTVVDAGASLGDNSCTYAKLVGPSGRVLAFEPHPISFQGLKLNFDRWKNVICVNKALSDREGEMPFVCEVNVGASHLEVKGGDKKVPCIPLDSWFTSFERCDLIHLDCEGFETRVLMGARKTIAHFRPVLVLEVNHGCLERYGLDEMDVHVLLDDMNYRWEEIEPHHGPHCSQRDIICFPQ